MRNYKKEIQWRKMKYIEIRANIEKELGNNLKEKLKNEGKTISKWVTENAQKYINQRSMKP